MLVGHQLVEIWMREAAVKVFAVGEVAVVVGVTHVHEYSLPTNKVRAYKSTRILILPANKQSQSLQIKSVINLSRYKNTVSSAREIYP